jgi:hypothetical protein
MGLMFAPERKQKMNGKHRILAIAIAGLGLAGGLAAGVVPASAAPHAATSVVCTWMITVNGTNFFESPGQGVIETFNKGVIVTNPGRQTGTNGGVTYEHAFRNGVGGWINETHLSGHCASGS